MYLMPAARHSSPVKAERIQIHDDPTSDEARRGLERREAHHHSSSNKITPIYIHDDPTSDEARRGLESREPHHHSSGNKITPIYNQDEESSDKARRGVERRGMEHCFTENSKHKPWQCRHSGDAEVDASIPTWHPDGDLSQSPFGGVHVQPRVDWRPRSLVSRAGGSGAEGTVDWQAGQGPEYILVDAGSIKVPGADIGKVFGGVFGGLVALIVLIVLCMVVSDQKRKRRWRKEAEAKVEQQRQRVDGRAVPVQGRGNYVGEEEGFKDVELGDCVVRGKDTKGVAR